MPILSGDVVLGTRRFWSIPSEPFITPNYSNVDFESDSVGNASTFLKSSSGDTLFEINRFWTSIQAGFNNYSFQLFETNNIGTVTNLSTPLGVGDTSLLNNRF